MASPQLANGHISTPPPSDPATTTATARPEASTTAKPDPDVPLSSLQDDGLSKRPRDARLIHTVLQNLGVQSYQERVPLQLLDFAYRYTSGVLSDSLRLSAEGYAAQNPNERKRGGGAGDEGGNITVTALRQAIASRQGYAFESALPKEFMLEQAAERNRVALPKVERGYGVLLPEEKYCLTGIGWGLKEEWDSEEEEEERPKTNGHRGQDKDQEDEAMGGMDGENEEDEEGGGRMEDVFGEEGGDGGDDAMKED